MCKHMCVCIRMYRLKNRYINTRVHTHVRAKTINCCNLFAYLSLPHTHIYTYTHTHIHRVLMGSGQRTAVVSLLTSRLHTHAFAHSYAYTLTQGLDGHGVYLIDNGLLLLMWIGKQVPSQLLVDLLNGTYIHTYRQSHLG